MEDIAVYVEKVYCYPNWFEKVLNPYYELCYDSRYKKKLDLLKQYGFISDLEYSRVMEATAV